jgi:hypothetical protein
MNLDVRSFKTSIFYLFHWSFVGTAYSYQIGLNGVWGCRGFLGRRSWLRLYPLLAHTLS